VRHIQSGLARLADENLVHLPLDDRGLRDYGFTLLRDDARAKGENDVYKVPDNDDEYFTVPLSLFTNGWIYVLEDGELVLLLIAARFRKVFGDAPHPMAAGPRKLNYGLTKDSYEPAHRVLDYLSILDVIADWRRSFDGTVDGFASRVERGERSLTAYYCGRRISTSPPTPPSSTPSPSRLHCTRADDKRAEPPGLRDRRCRRDDGRHRHRLATTVAGHEVPAEAAWAATDLNAVLLSIFE